MACFQRASRIAGPDRSTIGTSSARHHPDRFSSFGQRASAVELADAYFMRNVRLISSGASGSPRRLLVRARRRGEVARLLGMPAGEIFAEEVFGTGCRWALLGPGGGDCGGCCGDAIASAETGGKPAASPARRGPPCPCQLCHCYDPHPSPNRFTTGSGNDYMFG